MSTITARLDDDTQHRLGLLAQATKRSRSWLVAEAVRKYVKDEEWQITAIQEGINDADAGNFATEEEVKNVFARWGVDAS